MSALMKKYICWNEDLLWEITWYGLFRQTSINYIDECLIANNREVNAYFIVEKWVMPGDMEIPAPFNYKHFSENQTIFSSNTRVKTKQYSLQIQEMAIIATTVQQI